MKNPATYLRKAIYSALSSLSYNSASVPVYENEFVLSDPFQVSIRDYRDADAGNQDSFISDATQVIEVVSIQKDATRKAVDEIGELVMDLLKPEPSSLLVDDSDFSMYIIGRPSINHLTEDSGDGTIVRLIMRFRIRITQKTF